MEKLNGENLAEVVANSLNSFNDKTTIADFVLRMKGEHRTLQQAFTRLSIAWLKDLSVREHFDQRNEASVKLAKKIYSNLEECDDYLPLI